MPDQLLAGWGRTAPTRATVQPLDPEQPYGVTGRRGVVARGLGRAYNDAAQNAGGLVLSTPAHAGLVDTDWERGVVSVRAGTSIGDLISAALPHGWFPAVVPGTAHVTVGGAIAADIHGKNHDHGSFCDHVDRIRLATPAAGVVEVGPGDPRFRATAGGMGLTGVILDATLRLLPAAGGRVAVTTDRYGDLDGVMSGLLSGASTDPYSVAWIDALGPRGRGLVSHGDHAAGDSQAARPVTAPAWAPTQLLNRPAMRAFNELWYRAPRPHDASIDEFFFPLDRVERWNHLYGRRGFVQYQFVVPYEAADVVHLALDGRLPSYLAVLKQFTRRGQGHLSFTMPGWTLALDIPTDARGLARQLDALDERVADAGGRVYLAKDGRVRPELLEAMYPELEAWRAVRRSLDPRSTIQSDLGRRLGLL